MKVISSNKQIEHKALSKIPRSHTALGCQHQGQHVLMGDLGILSCDCNQSPLNKDFL